MNRLLLIVMLMLGGCATGHETCKVTQIGYLEKIDGKIKVVTNEPTFECYGYNPVKNIIGDSYEPE